MGAMQGITVRGVALVTTALWLPLGLGPMDHRSPPDSRPDMATDSASDSEALLVLKANVHGMGNLGPGDHGPETHGLDQAITSAVLADHTDTARALLYAAGASQDELDHTQPVLRSEGMAASRQMKADADRVAHGTSMAFWVAFLAGLFGLPDAAIGGGMGAGNVHRVHHLRRYAGRPYRSDRAGEEFF